MPFPDGIVDALDPARLRLLVEVGRRGSISAAADACPHGQRVLDTLDGMQDELRALLGAERGRLTLAASTTPGSYVLPSILNCFADRHPGVDVDVVIGSSTSVAAQGARREVSLGIAGEVELPDGVVAEPFLDDELVGVAAPGQLRVRRGRARPDDVAEKT